MPRSHHCNACGQCVLKRDHHCPWLGTCVGQENQKHFWLFLLYTMIGLIATILTVSSERTTARHFNAGVIVSVAIFMLVLVLFVMQTYMIHHNWTQHELNRGDKMDIFNSLTTR